MLWDAVTERRNLSCKSPYWPERAPFKVGGMLSHRWGDLMVGGNRKSAILERACSCELAKQLHCGQLWSVQRLDRPWRWADNREELGSTKGTQLRDYGPLHWNVLTSLSTVVLFLRFVLQRRIRSRAAAMKPAQTLEHYPHRTRTTIPGLMSTVSCMEDWNWGVCFLCLGL